MLFGSDVRCMQPHWSDTNTTNTNTAVSSVTDFELSVGAREVSTLRKKGFQKVSSAFPTGEPFLVPGRIILGST
jgi:hypothetical protein